MYFFSVKVWQNSRTKRTNAYLEKLESFKNSVQNYLQPFLTCILFRKTTLLQKKNIKIKILKHQVEDFETSGT